MINWDIKRTYVGHGFFQEEDKKEALYKISKAYSVYDEEVGYCQGFSFMAAVVLLQVCKYARYAYDTPSSHGPFLVMCHAHVAINVSAGDFSTHGFISQIITRFGIPD